jgi:hypothetical protein
MSRAARPLAALVALLMAATGGATLALAAPPTLRLELDASVDEARLRAAVERELAAGEGGVVAISVRAGRASVRYRDPTGKANERAIRLPSDPERAEEAIALLVANLVRDQHSALLGLVRPPGSAQPSAAPAAPAPSSPSLAPPGGGPAAGAPAPPPGAPAPAAPAAPSAPAASAASVGPAALPGPIAPIAPADSARAGAEGVSIGQQPARLASPCDPGGPRVAFGADLVPHAGTSLFDGGSGTSRDFSLHLLVGAPRSTRHAELSGVAGWDREGACGAQVAGVAAQSGGRVEGLQLGGAAAISLGHVRGVQAAGLLAYARSLDGVQVSPVSVGAGPVVGAQLGAVNVATGDVAGVQLGAANVATGDVAGLQVGVLNVARTSGVSLGLLNVIWGGDTHIDAVGTETGTALGLLANGGRHLHNLYGGGVRPTAQGARGALAFGLGTTLDLAPRLTLDIGLLLIVEPGSPLFRANHELAQLRVLLGFAPAPHVSLLVGPTLNVLSTEDLDHVDLSPWGAAKARFGSQEGRIWPGVTAGLRAF